MFGIVKGVLAQLLAGEIRAFPAMGVTLVLAAGGYWTLPMKGVALRLHAAAAAVGRFERAPAA